MGGHGVLFHPRQLLPQALYLLDRPLGESVSLWRSPVLHPALRALGDLEPAAGADQVFLAASEDGNTSHLETNWTLQLGLFLLNETSQEVSYFFAITKFLLLLLLKVYQFTDADVNGAGVVLPEVYHLPDANGKLGADLVVDLSKEVALHIR